MKNDDGNTHVGRYVHMYIPKNGIQKKISQIQCTITKPRREWQRIQISSRGNTLFHEWSLHTQLTEHF